MEVYMFGSDQNLSLHIFLTLLSIWLFHKVYIKYHSWATAWQNQQNGVHPAKTQINLDIHPVLSASSLWAKWIA